LRRRRSLAAGFGIALISHLDALPAHAQLGIWTSQDRHVSSSNTQVPTVLGLGQGATLSIGTFTPVASASGFTEFTYASSGNVIQQHSLFTPESLILSYSSAFFLTAGGGNLYFSGSNFQQHVEATFHLDSSTPYAFGNPGPGLGPPLQMPSGHPLTLEGPGEQTINLSTVTNGVLSAGDWHLLLEYQAI
jgi:hypothetical protein